MADDKTNVGARDRAEVAAGESYEVADFARSHGITQEEAKALIGRVGNNRAKLETALAESRSGTASSTGSKTGSRSTANTSSTRGARATGARAKPAARAPGTKPARKTPSRRGATSSPSAGIATAAAAKVQKVTEPIARRARTTVTAARDRVLAASDSIGKATRSTGRAVRARGADLANDTKSVATSRGAKIVGIAAVGAAVGLVANLGRKAMVQAPTALAGDWLEGLKAEHRSALALFDLIENTSGSARTKRTALFADLKHALAKHAFTEENVIYPALRQHGGEEAADRFTHNHGYVKQHLFELDALPKDSPAFLEKLGVLRADLEKHIREEEDAVLPPLHASLGKERNAQITALANREGFKLA